MAVGTDAPKKRTIAALPRLERASPDQDDHAMLRAARDIAPLAISPLGIPITLHWRHVAPLADPALTRQLELETMAMQGITGGPLYELFANTMLFANGAAHQRRRAPIQRTFAFKLIEKLRGEVAALAGDLVETRLGAGPFDFLEEIAGALPARIIARILGVSDDDIPAFRREVYSAIRGLVIHDPAIRPSVESSVAALADYVDRQVAERRANPLDDFLTHYVAAADEDDALTGDEVRAQLVTLIVAGSDTTRVAICAALTLLVQHPAQWRALCADPHGLKAKVADEPMRFEPSVASFPRVALEDFELDGVALPKGGFVVCSTMAAMRDPELYAEPDRFDIHRDDHPKWHPIFGAGAHRCLGEALARVELEETIAAVAERAPNAALVGAPPAFRGLHAVRAIDRMQMRFD